MINKRLEDLREVMRREHLVDQGDRSLIFYFERGRDSGVKATSVSWFYL
jgi:hypothetical protein